jgi:hypothetical protein
MLAAELAVMLETMVMELTMQASAALDMVWDSTPVPELLVLVDGMVIRCIM